MISFITVKVPAYKKIYKPIWVPHKIPKWVDYQVPVLKQLWVSVSIFYEFHFLIFNLKFIPVTIETKMGESWHSR